MANEEVGRLFAAWYYSTAQDLTGASKNLCCALRKREYNSALLASAKLKRILWISPGHY